MRWDSLEFEERLSRDMNAAATFGMDRVIRLNLAIVLALMAHFGATIWWASQITTRLDAVVIRVQEVVSNDLGRLERRLDKLEERVREHEKIVAGRVP